MRTMRFMRHLGRTAEKICFVWSLLYKTNFLGAGSGKNASYPFICFMFSLVVRTFSAWKGENMRIMRMYEAMFINGFYLPCFIGKAQPAQKHEANMKMYEEVMA